MAGKIKIMIEQIMDQRCRGNQVAIHLTRAKLIMKGINPDSYTPLSDDDPQVLKTLQGIARELGVNA